MPNIFEQEKYKKLIDNYKESQEEILVSFCGRFKTGKSTLINRILGRDILPTKVTTATAVITRIEYGDKEAAFIEKNGKRTQVSFEEAKEAILFDDSKDLKRNAHTTVVFKLPLAMLKSGVVLVDTPGTDDYDILEEISLSQACKSSLCVIVFQAKSFNGLNEKKFCEKINENLGGNVVFVANKCDIINSSEQFQHLVKQENATLKKFGNDFVGRARIFNTSCDKRSVDLDGFDGWLANIIARDKAVILQSIANSQRTVILHNALAEMLLEDIAAAEGELDELKGKQEDAVASAIRDERSRILEIRTKLTEYKKSSLETLRAAYGIGTALDELKTKEGWGAGFSANSKSAVICLLEKRFNEVRAEFNRKFGTYIIKQPTGDIRFNFPAVDVRAMLSGVTFPAADITGGSSGTGIGLAVGLGVAAALAAFSFGAAAPLGALVARSVSDAARRPAMDNSNATTTSFVEREVFPSITAKIDQIFAGFNASLNKAEASGFAAAKYDGEIKALSGKIDSLRGELVKTRERKLSI